jgi:hypothetical protein
MESNMNAASRRLVHYRSLRFERVYPADLQARILRD